MNSHILASASKRLVYVVSFALSGLLSPHNVQVTVWPLSYEKVYQLKQLGRGTSKVLEASRDETKWKLHFRRNKFKAW